MRYVSFTRDTADGSEILRSPVEVQVVYSIVFYRVSSISGGCLRFQPSTVLGRY